MATEKDELPSTSTDGVEAPMKWTAEEEIQLFFALDGFRPIGINKHFNMLFISERLSRGLNRCISSKTIWAHLHTLYNLEALNEMEALPFPNDIEDFSLPELEFADLLAKKRAENEEKGVSEDESSIDIATKEIESTMSKSNQHANDMKKKDVAKHAEIPKRSQRRKRK